HFVDSLFNYPVDYAEDLCREMIATNLDSRWSAIVSPKFLSEELMVLMKEAGCVQLHIGNESGSPKTLKSLQKEFSVDDIVNCFKLSHALEIFSMGYLLLGGPEEDLNTVEESISLMEEVKPSRLNITIGTRIYPHTPLYDISLREEVITTDNHLLQPAFYLARSIADVIWNRIEELEKTHPNWIVR
ncbi:MAG: B12-binding domain-containing radical SAM protein, partial [Thermodesulfobacteriota bacterium]|nr:B12-binding domain-containing radical SAM protein [Thermodesulfobacteriota bacterium]